MSIVGRSRTEDPCQRYRYLVTGLGLLSEGMPAGGFSKVSGLSQERGVVEYAEGGYDNVHKIPGRKKGGQIELEKGIMRGDSLLKAALTKFTPGGPFRFGLVIILQDDNGVPVNTWTLTECWISKWEGPELEATSDDVAIEKLTIEYEDMLDQIE